MSSFHTRQLRSREDVLMGNDGGSIPLRSELVKTKGAPKKVGETATANSEFAWKYCALSRAVLAQPLASDALGKLYNKESIIQYVLDNESFGDAAKEMSHVSSMKDVVELKVGKNEDKFICEVTGRDMNGMTKFVYLTTCGHTFAMEALKNIETSECLMCSKPYLPDDVISLNPSESELETLRIRMKRLVDTGLTHSGTAIKKKKRKAPKTEDTKSAKVIRTESKSISNVPVIQTAILKSLLHKNDGKIVNDGFMTRGTSSRVG